MKGFKLKGEFITEEGKKKFSDMLKKRDANIQHLIDLENREWEAMIASSSKKENKF